MGTLTHCRAIFIKEAQAAFPHGFVTWANRPLSNSGQSMPARRFPIGAAAIAHKLPLITYDANEMPYGPLLSYGPDFSDPVHRAVAYVDKILKGAHPADLPVEQPTKLKLVLSQKTDPSPKSRVDVAPAIVGAGGLGDGWSGAWRSRHRVPGRAGAPVGMNGLLGRPARAVRQLIR